MIVRIHRRSEPNAENFNEDLYCCLESEFRQGRGGETFPKTWRKLPSGRNLDSYPIPTLILDLRCFKVGEFGYCGLADVFRYVFERFTVL